LIDALPEKTVKNLDPKKVNLFRRKFLTGAGLAGAALAFGGPSGKLMKSAKAFYPTPFNDADILNFALNLEYLEAEFYLRATTGAGLAGNEVTGVGTLGPVTGGSQVPFAIPAIQAYAEEIANDEHNHVLALRGALGNAAVARPTINLQHSFTAAAVAAGIITAGQRFNPYADDSSFVLSAFVFEDVGVTAYHGAAPLIASEVVLSAAAGILAVEAYHAGSIRTVLYQLGQNNAQLITDANAISNLRAMADGMNPNGHDTPLTENGNVQIVAADPSDSIAYARTFDEVLRIVYLGNRAGQGGGFFPDGLNGTIR
jgi:hypothetical protein